MPDAALLWGGDLSASATGDVGLAADTLLGQQRVLRRLLTNPGDYIWYPDYGAGLGRFVGAPLDARSVSATIRSQIFKEAAVARTPEPVIEVESGDNGAVFVHLRYVDSATGATQLLSFSVSA